MQCHRATRRNVCGAHNAYDSSIALKALFGTTSIQKEEQGSRSDVLKHVHFRPWRPLRDHPDKAKQQYDNAPSSGDGHEVDGKSAPGQIGKNIRLVSRRSIRNTFTRAPLRNSNNIQDESVKVGRFTTKSKPWQRHILYIRDIANDWRTKTSAQRQAVDYAGLCNRMDYEGQITYPREFEMSAAMPLPWALSESEARGWSATHILRMEIERFGEYMQAKPAENVARKAVLDDVKAFIDANLNSNGEVTTGYELFGSEKTGLAVPFSDIDVRVFDVTDRETHKVPRKMNNRMKRLFKALWHNDKFETPEYRHGEYPIVTCQHRASGLDVQIVSSPDTGHQQEVTAKYLVKFPGLRNLFILIRTMFDVRGLLDVFHGGLGSYGTFVSILASINRKGLNPSKRDEADELRRFLSFYGNDLNTRHHGVAVFPRTLFVKHDRDELYRRYANLALRRRDPVRAGQWIMCQRRDLQSYLLCLQDPADPKNDLGKRSHAIKHIVETIKWARHMMMKNLKSIETCQSTGDEWSHESILYPLLGRCHEVYYEPRKKLQAFGQSVIQARRAEQHSKRAAEGTETLSHDNHEKVEDATR